jgi:RpiB/LacA/LacB family sugar-phosphate isomerase
MTIYLGADHRGFALKERLKQALANDAYTIADLGAAAVVPDDDYADPAAAVARKVAAAPLESRGIVICGSGFGVDIVANKVKGVRSALAMSPDHAYQGRHDDDVNVLALAADFVDEATALKIAKVFLTTPFAKEDRYARRLEKIGKVEFSN